MGKFGGTRRTKAGVDLLELCLKEDFSIAGTFHDQPDRSTGTHPRWGTHQEIDHFLVKKDEEWSVKDYKVLRWSRLNGERALGKAETKRIIKGERAPVGNNGLIAWSAYTDHAPIEITMKTAQGRRRWVNKGPVAETPDWAKLAGASGEAKTLKAKLGEELGKTVENSGERLDDWGTICNNTYDVALDLLGKREPLIRDLG